MAADTAAMPTSHQKTQGFAAIAACIAVMSSTSVALAEPSAAVAPSPDSDGYSLAPASTGYALTPDSGTSPKDVERNSDVSRRTGSVFLVRGGSYQGSGRASVECEGDCIAEGGFTYEEEQAWIVSLEWLSNISKTFRFGGGLAYTPTLRVKNQQTEELGSAVDFYFTPEFVIDASPKVAITLRGQIGMSLLIPSGDLQQAADAQAAYCDAACTVDLGPYLGGHAGIGPGLLFNLGSVGLRVDAQLQAYSYRTLDVEYDNATGWLAFRGTRSILQVGAEF